MTKTNILVTGANGQLGSAIREISAHYPHFRFLFTDLDDLDITDASAFRRFVQVNPVSIVINCAACTAVDKAEEDEEKAFLINAKACEILAKASHEYDFKLIHISTDFVFSGKQNHPYKEEDTAEPVSVYGKSKLEGEKLIRQNTSNYLILRTSWLYYQLGHNFVRTMLRLSRERDELRVVYDQVGCPTYAGDLAEAILHILTAFPNASGLYHYANEGVISWYDFTQAIMELSECDCPVRPILSAQFPTPAARPTYSVLDKTKIKEEFGIKIPYWRHSLKKCMDKMN